jgi:MSHA biogenesis protein MshP
MTHLLRNMRRRQRGVGLPVALFVITVMVTLTVAIQMQLADNAETLQEELMLTRAQFAADSGAGLALNALFPPSGYPAYENRLVCGIDVLATGPCGSDEYEFVVDELAGCRARVAYEKYAIVDEVHYVAVFSTGICGEVQRIVKVETRFEP